jgi:4'-phosphopantetheinyl transferase
MNILPPQSGQVDLWVTQIGTLSDGDQREYKALLSKDEMGRHNRFVVQSAKDQFLAARVLLRTTLSRYFEADPRAWTFQTNDYGRPFISGPFSDTGIYFNLSHTNGMVVCAISSSEKIGVDVERCDRVLDTLKLAATVFAPVEAARLSAASYLDRRELFFAFWTLKEAYIKARGMGLWLPLQRFWIDIDREPMRIHFTDDFLGESSSWDFWRGAPTEVHRIAVAAAFPGCETRANVIMRSTTALNQSSSPPVEVDPDFGTSG